MGKKNKGGTGSEAFDYSFGVGEAKSLMKRYGIEGASMGNPRMGGTQRSVKDVKKDIAAAMMNDYDTRRTLEASAMAGNKDAKKFAKKGIKAGKIQDAYGVMRDLKKEYVGGGGMDGAKNRAGLTYAAVKADRDAQTEAYDKQYASKEFLNDKLKELEKKNEAKQAEPVEYTESDEYAAAKERLTKPTNTSTSIFQNAAASESPVTAFREANDPAMKSDDASRATNSYLEQYKEDVIKGGKIGEARSANIHNAYNTVIGSDI